MTQYIPKSAVVEEIENRIKELQNLHKENEEKLDSIQKTAILLCIDECKVILSLINTLEVKEVNLEEKAIQLSHKYFPDEENIWARPNIEAQRCKSACLEMVEWFKAQKGE